MVGLPDPLTTEVAALALLLRVGGEGGGINSAFEYFVFTGLFSALFRWFPEPTCFYCLMGGLQKVAVWAYFGFCQLIALITWRGALCV
jgi:hypothetical protein